MIIYHLLPLFSFCCAAATSAAKLWWSRQSLKNEPAHQATKRAATAESLLFFILSFFFSLSSLVLLDWSTVWLTVITSDSAGSSEMINKTFTLGRHWPTHKHGITLYIFFQSLWRLSDYTSLPECQRDCTVLRRRHLGDITPQELHKQNFIEFFLWLYIFFSTHLSEPTGQPMNLMQINCC